MTEPPIELSSAGQLRKESILAMAKAQALWRRRRRKAAQAFAAAMILALLTSAFLLRPQQRPAPRTAVVPSIRLHADQQIAETIPKSRVVVIRIQTDPRIIKRLAIPPEPPRWKKIGDEELLRDLAFAHRPAGLAYIGDNRPVLLFRSSNTSSGG